MPPSFVLSFSNDLPSYNKSVIISIFVVAVVFGSEAYVVKNSKVTLARILIHSALTQGGTKPTRNTKEVHIFVLAPTSSDILPCCLPTIYNPRCVLP